MDSIDINEGLLPLFSWLCPGKLDDKVSFSNPVSWIPSLVILFTDWTVCIVLEQIVVADRQDSTPWLTIVYGLFPLFLLVCDTIIGTEIGMNISLLLLNTYKKVK